MNNKTNKKNLNFLVCDLLHDFLVYICFELRKFNFLIKKNIIIRHEYNEEGKKYFHVYNKYYYKLGFLHRLIDPFNIDYDPSLKPESLKIHHPTTTVG